MDAIGTFGSSGPKITMRGPILRELCVGRNREQTKKQTLDDEFHVFFQTVKLLFFWQFTTLAKYSRQAWSLFGANIS